MINDKYYTIKEVASMLEVSDKTIRRRIHRGQLQAILKEGVYGEQYYLPKSQFDDAIQTVEVLTVKKEYDIESLALVMAKYFNEKEDKLVNELHALKEELKEEFQDQLEQQLKIQEENIKSKVFEQIDAENKKLMNYIAVTREEKNNRSWFPKLFNKK